MEKFKINVKDIDLEIPRDKVQELVEYLEMDEIIDSIKDKNQIKVLFDRLCMDYWEEMGDLLFDFMNKRSDMLQYLTIEQKEQFINDYKYYLMNKYKN